MSKKVKLIILVILIIALGFLRDYFFMNMNSVYKTVQGVHIFHARDEFKFMLEWTEGTFMLMKWIGTFVFYGLFLILTWLIVKTSFNNRFYNKVTVGLYFVMLGVSAIIYVVGIILLKSTYAYHSAHTIMMFAQSFLPMLILVLIFKYLPITKGDTP